MPDNTDYLQGIIERLTFHSEETGYTVARLKVPKAQALITVVGNFANQAGQTLALEGTWRSLSIHISTMTNLNNSNNQPPILYFIDNTIITQNPNSI
jgi:hypothetical protein